MRARSARVFTSRSIRVGLAIATAAAAIAACDLDLPDGVPGDIPDYTDATSTVTGSSSQAASVSASASGTGGSSATGGFALALDEPAPEIDLAATTDLVLTVTSTGYAGEVALAVPDLSASGITAALGATTLTLDGATPATTTLTLTTASSATPGAIAIVVTGTTPGGENQATSTLLVRSAITITIPAGVGALGGTVEAPVTDAFGPYPTTITAPQGISTEAPVTVRFFNADAVEHSIHADQNGQGFGHGVNPIPPNAMDEIVREINAAGQYDYYLHDQGTPIVVGRLVVQ